MSLVDAELDSVGMVFYGVGMVFYRMRVRPYRVRMVVDLVCMRGNPVRVRRMRMRSRPNERLVSVNGFPVACRCEAGVLRNAVVKKSLPGGDSAKNGDTVIVRPPYLVFF